jgi:hypothetical protein
MAGREEHRGARRTGTILRYLFSNLTGTAHKSVTSLLPSSFSCSIELNVVAMDKG